MDLYKYEWIRLYFKLPNKIKYFNKRIEEAKFIFNTKSKHTRMEQVDLEWKSVAFTIELEVTNHVMSIDLYERLIEQCEKKMKYLKDYLQTLSEYDRHYIYERFEEGNSMLPIRVDVDEALFDEIAEIETAIQYMFGKEIREIREISELEILDNSITGNVESDFDFALKLLDVNDA